MVMKLTGSRCQCRACGEYFNSTYAFDKHRFGKPEKRYCMSEYVMLSEGLSRNKALFWITGTFTRVIDKTA